MPTMDLENEFRRHSLPISKTAHRIPPAISDVFDLERSDGSVSVLRMNASAIRSGTEATRDWKKAMSASGCVENQPMGPLRASASIII